MTLHRNQQSEGWECIYWSLATALAHLIIGFEVPATPSPADDKPQPPANALLWLDRFWTTNTLPLIKLTPHLCIVYTGLHPWMGANRFFMRQILSDFVTASLPALLSPLVMKQCDITWNPPISTWLKTNKRGRVWSMTLSWLDRG